MTDRYRFDRFELGAAERTLTDSGEPVAIGARAFDLLLALVERRDRVVSKSELLDLVWPGLVVEENNLQVQVSALRKVVGTAAIATISGRGYRFTATLRSEDAGRAAGAATGPVQPPTNLPPQRTRFIGRETALADCARLLASSRLITLSGIGGCGKTRLATALARRQLEFHPDGVWFVDLSPVHDGSAVAAAVAAALGVREVEGQSLSARIAAHAATRRMLVVLDNCEHLLDAVVETIESLLTAAPDLRIIATSREAFGIAGEQIYPVRSLSLPAAADLDAMRASEAVRVFVDRACLVVPDFALDAGNAPAVAEICRRLDGIALAIELAAARVSLLSIEEIRDRLDDRFRLLTGGGRALPRHQTLQAVMLWSYEHLGADEQRLFRLLSVFVGGWTLAAATVVAGAADEYAVLALLTALNDKSLLEVHRDSGAGPRYRMLETVRQYAQDRLDGSGEGGAARTRHLRHQVALAEAAEPLFLGARQGEAIARMRLEQDNLLAAHAWSTQAGDGGALGLRLAAASWRYWMASARLERGRSLAVAALAGASADSEAASRCRVLVGLATTLHYMGRYAETTHYAQQGLDLARQVGDLAQVAGALVMLRVHPPAGEAAGTAEARDEEIQHIARATGDRWLMARNLNHLAETQRRLGHGEAARRYYEEALVLSREAGNPGTIAVIACNFARLVVAEAQAARARELASEVLALTAANDLRGMHQHLLEVGAGLAAIRNDHRQAARLHGAALTRMRDSGASREPVDDAFIAPLVERSRASLGADAFDSAEAAGSVLDVDEAIADVKAWLERLA